jgi:hypothetical protein
VLNEYILGPDYKNENARMMDDVVTELQTYFNQLKTYINWSIVAYKQHGKIAEQFVDTGECAYPVIEEFFDSLAKDQKYEGGGKKLMEVMTGGSAKISEPYKNDYLGLSWLQTLIKKRIKRK